MRSIQLSSILCAALCAAASAQTFTVGGAVFDDPENPLFSGLDGVTVTVSGPGGSFEATTDLLGGVWSGFWQVEGVPAGTYTVAPAFDGFEFRVWKFGEIMSDAAATIDVNDANRAAIESVSFLAIIAGSGCDDGNACTTADVLLADGSCHGFAVRDGAACDDGNTCTSGDSCTAGQCAGTLIANCGGGGGGGGAPGGGSSPTADEDSDADGVMDVDDNCPDTPNGLTQGTCIVAGVGPCAVDGDCDAEGMSGRCSRAQSDVDGDDLGDACDPDRDGDGAANDEDGCPDDPAKAGPGDCGCGVPETEGCSDLCPDDPAKTAPGGCGCGVADADGDGDGTLDCNDGCPEDGAKIAAGACGCGVADLDRDDDGAFDCADDCPDDPRKSAPGACGCGIEDLDSDRDGTADCTDPCPEDATDACTTVNQPIPQTDGDPTETPCGIGCGQTGGVPLMAMLLGLAGLRLHGRRRPGC